MYVLFAAHLKKYGGKRPIKGQYDKGQIKKIENVNIKLDYDYFGVHKSKL